MLYLSDLYNYFVSQNKNIKFSSKDDDTTIVVHIDEPFYYSKTEDNDLLMYAPIRLCHTLTNKNKSHISEKSMKDAIPSAYNMPILGYIYKDDEGEYQFAGHEFFVNDKKEVEYEEVPTGVIPESAGLKLIKYDGDDRSYLEGIGIIWRTYSKASEIIEREKELSVSVELCVDELSFDSKNKELVIDKFRFSGVTILGRDRNTGEEIQPGMENSKISIADFSESNNSVFAQNEKVIKLLSELNEKLDGLNIDYSSRKEETEDLMKKKFEKKATEEEIKNSPSTEVFDETDGDGDGDNDGSNDGNDIDYYEPEEEQQDGETPGENNDPPVGGDDNPPSGDPEEVVGEPSAEDIAAAEAATETINALTNSSTAADVAAARTEYNALSDEAKTLIEPEVYAKLEAQETRIANQEAADAVTTMITALTDSSSAEDVAAARTAYEALTTEQKSLVTSQTLALLTAQEERIDGEAADAVTDLINSLTDESTAAEVQGAREAYDALTDTQKELISKDTLDKLEEQEERISNESVSNDDVPKKKRRNNNSLEIKYSVECKNEVKTHFSTLSEKLAALSDLVNITYGETDDTYYFVDADEDKKLVYMHDIWRDKHYRQSYVVKKDNYSLKGDRCELFARYLSQDEINEFEKMKSDFSLAIEKLNQYDSEDDKVALLQSNDYKQIRGTEVYAELAKKETYFSMPIEELEKKLDDALLKYAKGNELKFSAAEPEKKAVGMKRFGISAKKFTKGTSRYGGLCNKEN